MGQLTMRIIPIGKVTSDLMVFDMMVTPLFIGGIGMQEVLLIVLVVLLFFGGKKIPELMKGIGKGVRSFKEGMNNVEKEIDEIKDIEQKG